MTTLRTGQITDFGSQIQKRASDFKDAYYFEDKTTDGAAIGGSEYTPPFNKYHGIYRDVAEVRAVINKLASWTFGRGIQADAKNEAKLKKIKGFGKDSSRMVLKNQWRTAMICGDSFAHIVKDSNGRMTNLKPLNPQSITIKANNEGIITGYEMKATEDTFEPEDIYHLSYERIADEIHGIPFLEALISLIGARNEALQDLRILYHRNIKPILFFEVETDDTTKITAIETTINEAYKKSENVVIPAGVVKEIKRSSTPQYGTMDSLPYIKFIVRQFVTACGMPEVIMGWGEETTEASASIIYLSYQQEIEDMQLYNQEMVEMQLGITIELEFPASLEEKMQKNESKRGKGTTTDPKKDG